MTIFHSKRISNYRSQTSEVIHFDPLMTVNYYGILYSRVEYSTVRCFDLLVQVHAKKRQLIHIIRMKLSLNLPVHQSVQQSAIVLSVILNNLSSVRFIRSEFDETRTCINGHTVSCTIASRYAYQKSSD